MSEKEVIVNVDTVWKTYKQGEHDLHALKGVSAEVYAGEYLCIMGPSGSGKSTLFNMVGGLDIPTKGEVKINGYDIAKLKSDQLSYLRSKTVGYVFQSFNLIEILTAVENVALPMIFSGIDEDEANEKASKILERVGLGHRLHHTPSEISGGQQQRMAIARALANDPKIILADEPTGNLDLKTGESIIELLKELSQEKGTTVIAVTHDMKMFNVSDRIIWIKDGNIDRVANRDELDIKIGGIS